MDRPELVTVADRRIMIGVLANLAAAFLGAVDHLRAAGSLMRHMSDCPAAAHRSDRLDVRRQFSDPLPRVRRAESIGTLARRP